jgi:tyrosyl-tRNA synthetase
VIQSSELSPAQKELALQMQIIRRGAVEMLPDGEFEARVKRSILLNKPLRVKQGFDPTSPDIHLGHTVGIRKLKQFQDLGHKVVLIVGDYTALVGDPSGQSQTRPQLAYDDIMRNAETYQKQFFKILDKSKTEVRFNGEWFSKMSFTEVMHLATKFTVARILERDDFTKRMKSNTPISIHELFYPLMQGYDSVAIEAGVELGATEQTFNLLCGRVIQEAYGQEPQLVLTMPILVGLDGEAKMSKSLGNYIGIDESPKEIFGKAMSIPDNLIQSYFELATDVTMERLEQVRQTLAKPDVNPMTIKKELGETLVEMYNSPGSGATARDEFEKIFSRKEIPSDIQIMTSREIIALEFDPNKLPLVKFMAKAGLAKSNSDARQLIEGGGVAVDSEKVADVAYELSLNKELIIKVGKRRFLKLVP